MSSDTARIILEILPTTDLLPTYVSDATSMDLRAAVEHLPLEDRAIVAMYLSGYSQEEIGEACDITQQAISLKWLSACCEIGMQI